MEEGINVDTYQSVGFDFWVISAIVAIIVVAVLLAVFLIGFKAGSAESLKRAIIEYQKDREHRRIIRMQAVPRSKKSSRYTGYYPSAQARRNQAKYRRAREEQYRMRNK